MLMQMTCTDKMTSIESETVGVECIFDADESVNAIRYKDGNINGDRNEQATKN
jgi:hypothetical protein